MSKMMRAIRVSEFGAPSVLKLCSDVKVPQAGHRQVRQRTAPCGRVTGAGSIPVRTTALLCKSGHS